MSVVDHQVCGNARHRGRHGGSVSELVGGGAIGAGATDELGLLRPELPRPDELPIPVELLDGFDPRARIGPLSPRWLLMPFGLPRLD